MLVTACTADVDILQDDEEEADIVDEEQAVDDPDALDQETLERGVESTAAVLPPPVIPGGTGFGITTRAGRGGVVHRVRNLNASGPDSLKACIDASGPRVCVFEVSGTIRVDTQLVIRNPYITIAGQTAPSPGITLRGATLIPLTHDVLVQHIRIRTGDVGGITCSNRDSLTIGAPLERNAYNVIFDHCSFSWGLDETVSTWARSGRIYDVTVSNSIISEAIWNECHEDHIHGYGLLFGRHTRRVASIGNLLAHNYARNPLVRDDVADVVLANNLIYNPGPAGHNRIYIGSRGSLNLPLYISIVGNYLLRGLDSGSSNALVYVHDDVASGSRAYLSGNFSGTMPTNQWSLATNNVGGIAHATSAPVWPRVAPAVIPSSQLVGTVLSRAGARPADRDAVDTRVVASVRNRTGRNLKSQSQVGGWPTLARNVRAFVVPANPSGDDDNDGYTNLEEKLHQMAAAVE